MLVVETANPNTMQVILIKGLFTAEIIDFRIIILNKWICAAQTNVAQTLVCDPPKAPQTRVCATIAVLIKHFSWPNVTKAGRISLDGAVRVRSKRPVRA